MRIWISNVWIACGNRVTSEGNAAGKIRVIDIEKSVVGVVGVKGESE